MVDDSAASQPADSVPRTVEPHEVARLTPEERNRLFELMAEHFAGVQRATFERDLSEKEWVFLVRDAATRRIEGFSTLTTLRTELDGQPTFALFTGDTVLDPRHWGDRQFVRVVGSHMFHLAEQLVSQGPVYWILLTCTHRSYRFLPGFFLSYAPHPDRATSPEYQRLLEAFLRPKFPEEFNAQRGLVELLHPLDVCQQRLDDPATQSDDPFAAFFFAANPGYARGDYLCCITDFQPSNVNRLGRRLWRI